ncbi:MAG: glycosyltransferase family 4 protein [Candidatus Promineifilaceae bacterium]
MKFCIITSFFELHNNEALHLNRVSDALLRRGHEVHVICSGDDVGPTEGQPTWGNSFAEGLTIHRLNSGIGRWALLFTRQTGRTGNYRNELLSILKQEQFDVIHLHDISSLGGVELIERIHEQTSAVQIMSVRDHWLLCPLSRLWQFNSRPCEMPDCTRCTLSAGKLPQLWRTGTRLQESLNLLDALVFPSDHIHALHHARGIDLKQATVLPSFIPENWAGNSIAELKIDEPYFAITGELIKAHGVQTVISLMKHLPTANLYIEGTGAYASELHAQASDLNNVVFLGALTTVQRAHLIRNATALITPTLQQEPIGESVLEAFSQATPALVRNLGTLPDLIARSGGGMLFDNSAELLDKMQLLLRKSQIAKRMGLRGQQAWRNYWSESQYIALYIDLVRSIQLKRDLQAESSCLTTESSLD